MYDRELTETSKGALLELLLSLGSYRNDIVLVGGWAPYFLTYGHFDHCGSIDIDFVLRPSIIIKYESIREIVNSLGYKPTPNIFRFERVLASAKNERKYSLHLDFLTEPDAAMKNIDKEQLVEVQKDLKACLIAGSSIVFDFNCEETIKATIPGNGEADSVMVMADIVGSLAMKGQALRGRFKDKDYYDVYAVTGFHDGNPQKAGASFTRSIRKKGFSIKEPIIWTSLSTINNSFSSLSRVGPAMVSRFVGGDTRTDAYERVNAFLQVLAAEFSVRF
jgi:hypothetical protein